MDRDCLLNYVSPSREMFAYETLWGIQDETRKTLHARFRQHDELPSQLLERVKAEEMFHSAIDDLHQRVKQFIIETIRAAFSVCVRGTFQYPETLRATRYPVELFYYRGNLALAEGKSVSIVGSRKATKEGAKRAKQLAEVLVAEGYTIISGLATGIDTAAMQQTIICGGRTIGVIGTPIHESYPKENAELQETVATEHLLFSHVPFYRHANEPFTARKYYFPQRNELMAALSEATIIVEASDTSGSLTQARACLQQNKKLFILNSCFENPDITWPATYERRGAIRVRTAEDIFANLKPSAANGTDRMEAV